ncbi:MAG TPA: class I SAM-dependent methyltransferase [Desulfobacteria bacterium]|nr:class I SAM-dependent methyltransferase [Desulfobacteria bacterium]
MLKSALCKQADFDQAWFTSAMYHLNLGSTGNVYRRKNWEWCYIYQALLERGLLVSDKKGLGFGVGKEPLIEAFAANGCTLVATDLDPQSADERGWSGEHAVSKAKLNAYGLCAPHKFTELVSYEFMDMNRINPKHFGQYDFTWSSCSLEHLGSLELGRRFILEQMNCLKPGGVAVHTTEYNLSSEHRTITDGPTVIYRKSDIEEIVYELSSRGYRIEVDYSIGYGPIESFIHIPERQNELPYCLRLKIGKYVSTSIALIIFT